MAFHDVLVGHLEKRRLRRSQLHEFLVRRSAERGSRPPSKATVGRYCTGHASPPLEIARDIAGFLGVSLEQLVGDPDGAPGEPTADPSLDEGLVRGICSFLGSEASLRRLLMIGARDACICAERK
jgi:hypothetical protein